MGGELSLESKVAHLEETVRLQLEVLQEVADVAWWGPRGPEGGNCPGSETFSPPDATFRIGVIFGILSKIDVMPSQLPAKPGEARA